MMWNTQDFHGITYFSLLSEERKLSEYISLVFAVCTLDVWYILLFFLRKYFRVHTDPFYRSVMRWLKELANFDFQMNVNSVMMDNSFWDAIEKCIWILTGKVMFVTFRCALITCWATRDYVLNKQVNSNLLLLFLYSLYFDCSMSVWSTICHLMGFLYQNCIILLLSQS